MRHLALWAIRLYQRHLSPRKGFCCAYRVHTGRAGCSALGARVIRRFGVWGGLLLLRQRLRRCSDVHRWAHPGWHRPPAAQRGDCDCDFGGVDCDGCDCGDCDRSRRRRERPAASTRRRTAR
jgi:putative component of membrane protein insertase Oxa1/YidC/SpoIIIJ protein YidD